MSDPKDPVAELPTRCLRRLRGRRCPHPARWVANGIGPGAGSHIPVCGIHARWFRNYPDEFEIVPVSLATLHARPVPR